MIFACVVASLLASLGLRQEYKKKIQRDKIQEARDLKTFKDKDVD
jgi:hypothetical protein